MGNLAVADSTRGAASVKDLVQAKGGVQVANLGLNTASLGSSTLASSGLVQSASLNVSQSNYAGALAGGSFSASVTGLTQAATTTINSAVNGAAIIR